MVGAVYVHVLQKLVGRRVAGTAKLTSLRIWPQIWGVPMEGPQPRWFTLGGDSLWPRRLTGILAMLF